MLFSLDSFISPTACLPFLVPKIPASLPILSHSLLPVCLSSCIPVLSSFFLPLSCLPRPPSSLSCLHPSFSFILSPPASLLYLPSSFSSFILSPPASVLSSFFLLVYFPVFPSSFLPPLLLPSHPHFQGGITTL